MTTVKVPIPGRGLPVEVEPIARALPVHIISPLTKRPRPPPRHPPEEPAARLCWGDQSQFQFSIEYPPASEDIIPGGRGGLRIIWPDEGDLPGEVILEFEEIEKTTEDFRIENPEDEDQYVIVQRRMTSTFRTPFQGFLWRFTWKNDDLPGEQV